MRTIMSLFWPKIGFVEFCRFLKYSWFEWIITKTIENHSKEKETLLLLHSLNSNDIELTLEQCVDILSLFTQCDIFIQLHNKFHENKQIVDIDTDYLIEQKEKDLYKRRKTFKYSIHNWKRRN